MKLETKFKIWAFKSRLRAWWIIKTGKIRHFFKKGL